MLKKIVSSLFCSFPSPTSHSGPASNQPAQATSSQTSNSGSTNVGPPSRRAACHQQRKPEVLGKEDSPRNDSLLEHAHDEGLACLTWATSDPEPIDLIALDRFVAKRFDREMSSSKDPEKLNRFLIRLSDFFLVLERRTGVSMKKEKFSARKQVFMTALKQAKGKPLDVVEPYRSRQYFPEQTGVLTDVARDRLVSSVMRHFGLPATRQANAVRRITRKNINEVSQGEYVLHVSNLFNLENQIKENDMQELFAQLSARDQRHLAHLAGPGLLVNRKFKDAIPFLVSCFPVQANATDAVTRNMHPASLLLQKCTGMIFHVGQANEALTNSKSPYAFENVAMTLAFKYFDAEHHQRLPAFFEEAFVVEQPCYEAVVENMMNFDPCAEASPTIFHPKPVWDHKLAASENASGMLVWVERELLIDYAVEKRIDLGKLSLQDVNQIESSSPYAKYLMGREPAITARMQSLVGNHMADDELRTLVHEDLLLGLAMV